MSRPTAAELWWCEHAWVAGAVADAVTIEVTDRRISAVTTDTKAAPDANRLHGLVIPGLANAHSHAFHRALRSRTQLGRGSFWTWRNLMYETAARLDPDSYRTLARAVYAEMALAGISTVGEFHYLHHDADGRPYGDPNAMAHALVDAARDAGIRLTLLDTCYLRAGLDDAPLTGTQLRFGDGTAEGWAERVADLKEGDDVRIAAAIHSVRAVPTGQMRTVAEWATGRDTPLHVHACEQIAEVQDCMSVHGCTPITLLRDHGVLGPRTTVVHATHLTYPDLADLADSRTGTCLCPTTERDLGDGIGPAAMLIVNPGRLSLGSDSHAVIDLFEEARAIELDERLARRERGIIAADRLLAAATLGGHLALGWTDAGTLAPGGHADLVAVDLDSVRTAGGGATVENVVFAATAADVTDVVVDGRPIVRNRVHLSTRNAAEPSVADELNDAITALMEPE